MARTGCLVEEAILAAIKRGELVVRHGNDVTLGDVIGAADHGVGAGNAGNAAVAAATGHPLLTERMAKRPRLNISDGSYLGAAMAGVPAPSSALTGHAMLAGLQRLGLGGLRLGSQLGGGTLPGAAGAGGLAPQLPGMNAAWLHGLNVLQQHQIQQQAAARLQQQQRQQRNLAAAQHALLASMQQQQRQRRQQQQMPAWGGAGWMGWPGAMGRAQAQAQAQAQALLRRLVGGANPASQVPATALNAGIAAMSAAPAPATEPRSTTSAASAVPPTSSSRPPSVDTHPRNPLDTLALAVSQRNSPMGRDSRVKSAAAAPASGAGSCSGASQRAPRPAPSLVGEASSRRSPFAGFDIALVVRALPENALAVSAASTGFCSQQAATAFLSHVVKVVNSTPVYEPFGVTPDAFERASQHDVVAAALGDKSLVLCDMATWGAPGTGDGGSPRGLLARLLRCHHMDIRVLAAAVNDPDFKTLLKLTVETSEQLRAAVDAGRVGIVRPADRAGVVVAWRRVVDMMRTVHSAAKAVALRSHAIVARDAKLAAAAALARAPLASAACGGGNAEAREDVTPSQEQQQ